MTILTAILQGPLFDDNSDGSGDDSSNSDYSSSDGSTDTSSGSDGSNSSDNGSSTDSASSADTNSSNASTSTDATSTDSSSVQSTPDYSQPSSYMPSDYQYSTQPDQSSQQQTDSSAFTNDSGMQGSANGQDMNLTVHDGSSFTDPQSLANSMGVSYSRDPNSSTVYIGGQPFSVMGYDQNGNAQVGVRNVAETLGYNVAYNPDTNTVRVDKPAPDTSQQTPSTPTNVYDPTFLNEDPQSRLTAFAQNPDLANQEISRVQQVYNDAKARGDQTAMAAAQAWANQVTQVSGIGYANASQLPSNQGAAGGTPITGNPTNQSNPLNPYAYKVVGYIPGPNGGAVLANGQIIPTRGAAGAAGGGGGVPSTMGQLPPMPTAPAATSGQFGFGGNQPRDGFIGGTQASQPAQPFQTADLSNLQSQFMPYQQFNPNWDNYYNQAHSQLDPQYQAKYNDLMSKQATDLVRQDESMNRRGIFTSGLAEAAANDLRAKTTNAVANVFLQQQAAVNKMAQTLYQDAYKQYQSGNQMALKNNEYLMTQMMNQEKQAFTQWLGTQRLGLSQYQYAMTAWDKMATLIQNEAKQQQSADQFTQKQFMDLYKQDNLSAEQQAALQKQYDQMGQEWQKALLPYQSPTAYQQGQLDQGQQKINEKAAMDQVTALLKQMGIQIDQGKLAEAIRHNQSTETLDQQKLVAQINQWSAQNKLSSDRNALSAQQFGEKQHYDQAMIDKASAAAMDSMKRTQLEGYKAELSSIGQQINSYISAGHPEQVPQNLIDGYNNVMQKVNGTVSNNKPAAVQGPTLPYTPWDLTTDENGIVQSGSE